MRGKVRMHEGKLAMDRITPAYAGKSDPPERVILEKSGSPPPMRGKGRAWEIVKTMVGITPAYAGKRTTSSDRLIL